MLSRVVQIKLPPDVKGKTLLEYLSGRFTYHTRAEWEEVLAEGRVTLDGVTAHADSSMSWNQILEYNPRPRPEPEVNCNVQLLYQDERYIVLDKPPNLPCHPAGGFFYHTLWAILKEGGVPGLEPQETIHFVSRLDRETSGIVLLAKTSRAHTHAMKLLPSPQTVKTYWVVVEGAFPDFLQADGWLFHDPEAEVDKRRSFAFARPPQDIPAETASTTLRCLRRERGLSLVEATLGTGRFHQIRATMHSLGFPVLGDKIYGRDETIYIRFAKQCLTPQDLAALQIPRQALHAVSLIFEGHAFHAPPPNDWPLLPS
ncbi:MAG: RluA family pseudouridine synthase [Victivallales bacterium]|nr:RluA family pseudouridine synthase [Victivallales bacterium]